MNAETRRLKDIIIERLTHKLKDRQSVSYYELMIGCCHHIGINNFYDLINGMAYSDEIEVDDKGNISLVAKQPEKLYNVYMKQPCEELCVAHELPYEAAFNLSINLNRAVATSAIPSNQKASVLFTIS